MEEEYQDSDAESVPQMEQEEKDRLLMKAAKEGDYNSTKEMIEMGANYNYEESGWTPLLWAACNGYENIVRELIRHGAHHVYKDNEEENARETTVDEDEVQDNFKKVPDPAKTGRYTPMHWASYHGYYKVVWILMREKMNPLIKDMHGNNCIHQAAANGKIKVLKCFMQFGVDLNLKNARTHTPLDLATEPETRLLIQRGIKTTNCSGKRCGGSKFDFRNIQFYCETCGDFFCNRCSTKDWVFESKDSILPERPVCRCDSCLQAIRTAEGDLKAAMETNDFHTLDGVLSKILREKTDIDVKLRDKAEVLHLKLENELDIRNFIQSVSHVENYKTILKSVQTLQKKEEAARKLGVDLDVNLIAEINACCARLVAERNLRYDMENMYVSASTPKTVDKLMDLITTATDTNVEDTYMNKANDLASKMKDNIKARDTLKMLADYPQREYPDPEPLDAKGKPIKQKDDKKKAKKKRKKEEKFPMPEWAVQLDDVQKTVRLISELAARAEELHLEKDFLDQVDEELKRFKKEINYRKMKEEEERLEAEAKLLAKKKKKK